MFTLRTPRLIFRDLIHDDYQLVYALSQEPAVTRYQTWLRLSNESSARKWVENAIHHNSLQPREAFNLALAHADSGDAIGWIGWGRPSDRLSGDYDFGYALHPSAWGRGYMTEALSAAIQYMFEAQAAQLVYGECAKDNIGSARVMQKVGLTVTSECQHEEESDLRYSMTRSQWLETIGRT